MMPGARTRDHPSAVPSLPELRINLFKMIEEALK